MAMERPGNIVELGANAWLFPSPAAPRSADCFIWAHGGTPHSKDYRFNVPAGCTVNFMANFNASASADGGPVNGFKAIAGKNGNPPPIDGKNRFAGPVSCRDYILAKAVGTHYEAAPDVGHYVQINQALNELAGVHAGLQWLPNYVSIRNRTSWFRDTNVWLSRVIKLVRDYDANIVNFYCCHCRIYIHGKSETKNVKATGSQAFQ